MSSNMKKLDDRSVTCHPFLQVLYISLEYANSNDFICFIEVLTGQYEFFLPDIVLARYIEHICMKC